MRFSIFALTLSLLVVAESAAQENTQLGPPTAADIVNPAQPDPALPLGDSVPNPFRDFNAPSTQLGEPGFAEATDQNLLGPIPQNSAPATNRSAPSRRPTPSPVSASSSASSNRSNNSFSPRLARAAPIMGDSLSPTLTFDENTIDPMIEDNRVASFPTAGGATRRKIGENTGAFPTDRFIFNYNHFHNGIESFGEAGNIDRFTLGAEKTFLDGLFSVDVRLPLSGETDVDFFDPGRNGRFARNGSEIGNVSFNIKMLLTSDEDSAWVGGLVVDTPTGGAVVADLLGSQLKFGNDALHLAPFIGFLYLQGDDVNHQGFVQVDVATNGNKFTYNDGQIVTADFMEQTLLYVDYSLSKAIYNGNRADTVERISLLTEFHYTTTLEDSDVVVINTNNSAFTLASDGNRIDVLNFTAGIDTRLSCGTNIRFGTVVPLTDDDDRFFDIEFLAQVNIAL